MALIPAIPAELNEIVPELSTAFSAENVDGGDVTNKYMELEC
jgi:hypothetical protein